MRKKLAWVFVFLRPNIGMEPNAFVPNALLDDLVEACKRSTNNEQHVGCINLYEFLVWVLTSTLWWNGGNGAFKNLE